MGVIAGGQTPENASIVRKGGRPSHAPVKQLTKGEITAYAIKILTLSGWVCWQQNNARTRKGYTFKGRKGVCDIPGFNRVNARFLACEVKTINDRLSEDQKRFLSEVSNAGGLALIATQSPGGSTVLLIEFKDYINSLKKRTGHSGK